jgi:hypothetical protein
LQDPPKFCQIWIFGLKTNHLATLIFTLQKLPTKRDVDKFLGLNGEELNFFIKKFPPVNYGWI